MKNRNIYIFELILFAFIIIFEFLYNGVLSQFYEITIILFFGVSLLVLSKIFGIRKYKTFMVSEAIQISIISTMLYFLLTFLSGLVLGFLKNSYSLNILSILKNTIYLIVMIISEELIREMIANRCKIKKMPLIILTILYILLDIVLVFNINMVNSNLKVFIFISTVVLPIIARHLLCSYLVCNVGPVPGIIYRLPIGVLPYMLPIVPDLGYYVSSLVGILTPFIIYRFISRLVKESAKKREPVIKKNIWYINVPLVALLIVVVSLVSGIFKYQIMAIGSGSMEPYIHTGDAVIFEKYKGDEKKNAEVGDILVFVHHGKLITHRIVDKYTNNENLLVYQTKGDNNREIDNFLVYKEEVIGVVKIKINYLGLPSIWAQNLFKN